MKFFTLFKRVLLTSALKALFKDSKTRNYLIKQSNISISDALITRISIKKKSYYLKVLNSVSEALVNIFLFKIVLF